MNLQETDAFIKSIEVDNEQIEYPVIGRAFVMICHVQVPIWNADLNSITALKVTFMVEICFTLRCCGSLIVILICSLCSWRLQ